MYNFTVEDHKTINRDEFYNFENKVPFTTLEWLEYLQKLKKVKPVILRILEGEESIGFFTGGIIRFCGIRVLGSPFFGWIGQHMGFDLKRDVEKSRLIDDLIDFALKELRVGYIQLTDLNFGYDDVINCEHSLISGERYKTCYIDLTKTEQELFKNFKRGYKGRVKSFEKEGCTIEEDYSDTFIAEHAEQLKDRFRQKKKKAPNYRKKMKLIFSELQPRKMILSIKALDPGGMNIASSYYIGNQYMCMYASNASLTAAMKNYHPNQAIQWYAMRYWKARGTKVMDMGGSGDYKSNFGAVWDPKPIIIFSKNRWNYMLILGIKRSYGKAVCKIGSLESLARNLWSNIQQHALKGEVAGAQTQPTIAQSEDDQ